MSGLMECIHVAVITGFPTGNHNRYVPMYSHVHVDNLFMSTTKSSNNNMLLLLHIFKLNWWPIRVTDRCNVMKERGMQWVMKSPSLRCLSALSLSPPLLPFACSTIPYVLVCFLVGLVAWYTDIADWRYEVMKLEKYLSPSMARWLHIILVCVCVWVWVWVCNYVRKVTLSLGE